MSVRIRIDHGQDAGRVWRLGRPGVYLIGRHPQALQLRYLQTLVEVATENNSTTIFPVPIDFLEAFRQGQLAMARKESGGSGRSGT